MKSELCHAAEEGIGILSCILEVRGDAESSSTKNRHMHPKGKHRAGKPQSGSYLGKACFLLLHLA